MAKAKFPKAATLKFYFEYDKENDVLKYKAPWNPGEYGYTYGGIDPSKYGATIGNKGSVRMNGGECFSVKKIITAIS
tara:strand:- start:262 stop:492 length:231 start_codon:yes stop_codon:yes gene_type:complete